MTRCRLTLNYTIYTDRAGLSSEGFGGSIIAYLMRGEGGWVVVDAVELIS